MRTARAFPRRSRIVFLLAMLIVSILATTAPMVGAASQAAHAYGTAELWKTLLLSGSPTSSMQPSCTGRGIYLASGTYRWVALPPHNPTYTGTYDWGDYGNHEATYYAERKIYLAAGTYYWSYCLIPRPGYYQLESMLSTPGRQAAVLNATQYVWGLPDKVRKWGGFLVRLP